MSERSRRLASCYWITSKRDFGFVVVLLAVIVLTWSPAKAAEGGDTKSAGELTVHLGVVPAEITKGPGPHLAERPMHGGASKGQHEHHVVVAVYDSASNIRITDATVSAKDLRARTLWSSENTRAHDNHQYDYLWCLLQHVCRSLHDQRNGSASRFASCGAGLQIRSPPALIADRSQA